MEPTVIFENSEYFVVVKPAGWITNDADTTTTQPVLQTWARENLSYELKENKELRNGIVHRLDKETSGIILVAKTESSFWALQREFKEREVAKTYICLVHGQVTPTKGEINDPVGRLPWRRDRFGILPGGRDALTLYEVKGIYKNDEGEYSLIECAPKTGRTHQIRIHMKSIGHPIVADDFYAGRKTARNDRRWCSRLFLHAKSISFNNPQTGEKVNYEAELPEDLSNVLSNLTKI
jgi:23S rRNA pseudouridine1911/1915/1917 synthase